MGFGRWSQKDSVTIALDKIEPSYLKGSSRSIFFGILKMIQTVLNGESSTQG